MRFNIFTLLPTLATGILAAPATSLGPFSTFSDTTIFVPPSNYTNPRVLYSRAVLLDDGILLATWENYSPEPPPVYFPIFRSADGGETWEEISRVTDQMNGWGLRYQPFLYRLPRSIGAYSKGTILCVGNSIPTDLSSTQIDLYASTDNGYTWKFVSHIATGGKALPDNGLTPVWEPFILIYREELIVYYSDQRDPAHAQKLVHQLSYDLKTWEAPVTDVAYADYSARPGMATVSGLPNGSYIMTYEYGGGAGFSGFSFPVYYRISANPLGFGSSPGYPVVAGSVHPISSPYVVWLSTGGKNGTIAVSSGTNSEIFVNKALGEVDQWKMVSTPQPAAYSRHLLVMPQSKHLLIMGAGHLPPSTTNNVSLSVVNVS